MKDVMNWLWNVPLRCVYQTIRPQLLVLYWVLETKEVGQSWKQATACKAVSCPQDPLPVSTCSHPHELLYMGMGQTTLWKWRTSLSWKAPCLPLPCSALDNPALFYTSFLSLHCFCEIFSHCKKSNTEAKRKPAEKKQGIWNQQVTNVSNTVSLVPALCLTDETSTSTMQLPLLQN